MKILCSSIFAVVLFISAAFVSNKFNNKLAESVQAPERETVLEYSVDGDVKITKIPYGSNIHVVVNDGKLIDTAIPFN